MLGAPPPPVQAADAIDVDPLGQILRSVEVALGSFFALLPRLLLAAVVLATFVVLGRVLRGRLEPRLARLRTPSFGRVFSSLISAGLVVFGLAVALPLAFPAVNVATMLASLGLLGVAAGFAFQDILSNLLAGVLLIFRQPFVTGDQIEVTGIRGTVEGITIRETRIRTFAGRLVIVPNADVYTNPIEVQTDAEAIRSAVVVGVAYGSDLGRVRDLALDALPTVEGVRADPAPQAFYTEFGASAIDLDLRYWTDPRQADVRAVQDRVVDAIHEAFAAADVDIPFDIVTLDADESFAEALATRD